MIATTLQCLTTEELKSLVSGNFPSQLFAAAIEHLDKCATCQSTVHELETASSNSPDAHQLRSVNDTDILIESACQVAIQRLIIESPPPTFPDASLVANKRLGPYTILGAIGAGGMGMVYLAQHERLKRKCAIKFLPRSRVTDAGWLERFDREMTTIAALEHPNIVRATDAGHEDGWHYLVMEFLDGLDVGKIVTRRQRIDIADACQIIGEAALGLAYVHSRRLVHRDIKPSNLMLTRRGDVKLLDLGLVLAGDDPLAVHDRLTTAGHLMGTMPFMSPEQLLDSRHVDPASDVYSLGATLYRLIAGRVPHPNRHGLASQVLAITHEPPTSLGEVIPGIDSDLSAFVARLLSRDPSKRPSANEVAQTLPKWSSDANLVRLVRETEQQPDTEITDAISFGLAAQASTSPPRRNWSRWLMAGFAAASLILAGVIFKIQTERGELVIQSEADDVTVVVKQGDAMVERLQIQRGDNNRIELRQGTYTVEIDGANQGVQLTADRVVIQRSQPATIALQTVPEVDSDMSSIRSESQFKAEPARTYQGHPYSYWFDILSREQDAETLSVAMRAVEILSRETPQRTEAAQETMILARILGGMVIGGSNDQSGTYMSAIRQVFPHYLPEPGLEIIRQTLRTGNLRSRMAASWMLQDFLAGISDDSLSPRRAQDARDYFHRLASESDNDQAEIKDWLAAIATALQPDPIRMSVEDAMNRSLFDSAMELISLSTGKVDVPTWLRDYVQHKVNEADMALKEDPAGSVTDFSGLAMWLLNESLVTTAIDLHRTDQVDVPAALIAATIVHPKFYVSSIDRVTLLNTVLASFDQGAEELRKQLRQRIEKIVAGEYADASNFDSTRMGSGGFGGDFGGGGNEDPRSSLLRDRDFWMAVFQLLGEDTSTTAESLQTLQSFNDAKLNNSESRIVPKELQPALDAAIATLAKRIEEQTK